MDKPVVALAPWEILIAAHAGCMRQVENLKLRRAPGYGVSSTMDWQINIEGILGEFALSKYLGVRWEGKGKLRAPDVGEVDVRTRSRHHYDLILHDEDPDDRVFWLLTGINGTYTVHGCIRAIDGKRREYWRDPAGGRPAYFVPQSALHRAPQ